MAKYHVPLIATASTVVTVEADSEEEAIEKSYGQIPPAPCAQEEYDLGDWEPDENDVYKIEN